MHRKHIAELIITSSLYYLFTHIIKIFIHIVFFQSNINHRLSYYYLTISSKQDEHLSTTFNKRSYNSVSTTFNKRSYNSV